MLTERGEYSPSQGGVARKLGYVTLVGLAFVGGFLLAVDLDVRSDERPIKIVGRNGAEPVQHSTPEVDAIASPEAARHELAELRSLPIGRRRRQTMHAFFERWARVSLPDALAAALVLKGAERSDAINVVCARWFETDPSGAWRWVVDHQSGFAAANNPIATGFAVLIKSGRHTDVTALLQSLSPALQVQAVAAGMKIIYAKSGAEFTYSVLRSLTQQQSRSTGIAVLLQGIATDSANPFAVYNTIPADLLDENSAQIFATNMVMRDPEGTAAWAQNVGGRSSDAALKTALGMWAWNSDPLAATHWVLEHSANVASDIQPVIGALARADPELALKIALLGTGQMRQNNLNEVLMTWGATDPARAEQWILAQPSDELRKMLANNLASMDAAKDPLRAFIFANSLGDPASREMAVNTVINFASPAGRTKILAQGNLTPELRQRIEQRILHP